MPLKTKRITVTVPGEFLPLLEQRRREEHIPSDSKFFLSLLIFDFMTRAAHKVTGQVVNEGEDMLYRVVDEIVREFPTARTKTSKWLKERIEEILDDREPAT